MTIRLRRRVENAEQRIGDLEMLPEMICEARRRWEEEGVLPEHLKLRELILDIDRCLAEADASVPGPPD